MKNVVFFTGAGISAESGISTFRGDEGLWEGHSIEDVAHIDSWNCKYNRHSKRKTMLDFYNKRRKELEKVLPNKAHILISDFEKLSNFNVNIITQNVDNLHEKAGSKNILHLHGELTKARSTSRLNIITDIGYSDINLGDKCSTTESQLRPHVVWFGEDVPLWKDAIEIIKKADIIVIIGTSLQVYPAARVLEYITCDEVIIVNPKIDDIYKEDPNFICLEDIASIGVADAIDYIKRTFKEDSRSIRT